MNAAAVSTEIPYVGDELELFAHAHNWKACLRRQIAPFLGKRVLEVGAGIGATTRMLCDGTQEEWRLLEPDVPMATQLSNQLKFGELPECCTVQAGTVADVAESFDSLIYIDVLEHIPDDGGELAAAAEKVRPGGYVVVLSPAHQHLYTAFDQRIGHCRRYSKKMLADLTPASLVVERLRYLDSVGYLASLANRLLLKQSMPTLNQIRTWDGLMVPASRFLDPLLSYGAGKSVLCVWRKLEEGELLPEPPGPGQKIVRLLGLFFTMAVFATIALAWAPDFLPRRPRRFGFRPPAPIGERQLQMLAVAVGASVGAIVYALSGWLLKRFRRAGRQQ